MQLDEMMAELSEATGPLPREAMVWALDNWPDAGPRLLRLLDDYATGSDRSAEAGNALFLALHVMGAHGETQAFPALCRLLRDGEAAENVLGDAITETLCGILIGTFDGDLARLKGVIEDQTTDDFIREAAVLVMAYFTRTGRVADSEMRDYLARLLVELDPQVDDIVLLGCTTAVAYLGYEDMAPQVEALAQRIDDPYSAFEIDYFREALADAVADPGTMAGFEHDNIMPLSDPIGVLEQWPSFSGEADAGDLYGEPWSAEAGEPYVNPFRHVGRNDPCPCGSGKKFKKCCLAGTVGL